MTDDITTYLNVPHEYLSMSISLLDRTVRCVGTAVELWIKTKRR